MKAKKIYVAEFYKGYWRKDHLEGGERVGVAMMTKKGHYMTIYDYKKDHQFLKEKIG